MFRFRAALFATALLSLCGISFGQGSFSWYVAPGGTDGVCTSSFTPCATIQYAVDHARGFSSVIPTSDAVSVAAGTYNQIVVINKSLPVTSLQSAVIDYTMATGQTLVTISTSPTFRGFTLQNAAYGMDLNSSPVFFNNFPVKADITSNTFSNNAVGLLLRGLSGTVERNAFTSSDPAASRQGIVANQSFNISDFVIDSNTFQNLTNGILINNIFEAQHHTGLAISNNSIDSNATGIVVANTDASSVTGNTILNTSASTGTLAGAALVLAHDQHLTITGNTLTTGAKQGIRIVNFGDANVPDRARASANIAIHNNNISGFAEAGLFIDNVNSPGTGEYPAYLGILAATCNWWGSASGPTTPENSGGTGDAIVAGSGQVQFVPWLVAPGPNSSCSGGPHFVTSQTLGTVRNDFNGSVGLKFTVGSTPLTIYSLGRIFVAGNSGAHVLKLVQASTGIDLLGGSVNLALDSTPLDGQYKYATLTAPVVLLANTSYYLVSQETAGGDQWYDYGPVTSSNAAAVNGPAYQDGNGIYNVLSLAGQSYVPLTFIYTQGNATLSIVITSPESSSPGPIYSGSVPVTVSTTGTVASVQLQIDGQNVGAPSTTPPFTINLNTVLLSNGTHTLVAVASGGQGQNVFSAPISLQVSNQVVGTGTPMLTGQTPGGVRNNFSGFAGLAFTVGSSPLLVKALGRIFVTGNTGVHAVKLVQANTGIDVPGGSISVPMSGGVPGQYKYANLAGSVNLAANTTYYLVSEETAGGDQWYDFGPVTATNLVSVNGPAYRDGNGTYNVLAAPGQSYVPVNLLYGAGDASISVSISSPNTGVSASGSSFPVTVSTTGPIGIVQLQLDGNNVGAPSSVPPFNLTLNTTLFSNGPHSLTVTAQDGVGHTTSSQSVSITIANGSGPNPTPLIATQSLGTIRNNFGGFVGLGFTVGPTPISVTSLGRIFAPGNTGSHPMKLVRASDGVDVPGGSVSVSLAGGTAGQFKYGALAGPVVLQANTQYYFLSLETSGGDQWYDFTPVTTTGIASVDGPAYVDGNNHYVLVGTLPNYAYGPVSLLYQ